MISIQIIIYIDFERFRYFKCFITIQDYFEEFTSQCN